MLQLALWLLPYFVRHWQSSLCSESQLQKREASQLKPVSGRLHLMALKEGAAAARFRRWNSLHPRSGASGWMLLVELVCLAMESL